MNLPDFVQIEPVGQCNLACRMCPVTYRDAGGKPPAFMSFDAFCRVLGEFPAIKHLQLQGMGEPLLHPRFLDMVRHAAARGIEVTTNTNLTALSPRRAEELVSSGLAKLHVSIDAADAAVYEYIRVGSRLSRVLRNLELVQEAKKRSGASRPQIILVAVAMRRNLEELPRLVRLAAEYGVRTVSVQHLAHDFSEESLPEQYGTMRRFVEDETLMNEDPARVARCFDEARALAGELDIDLRLPNLRKKVGTRGCDWPWRGAYIAYTGEAMPCCMVATPDRANFGNVAKEGVVRVWNNEAYNTFRSRLASDDPPDICKGCAVYNGHF
jgi:radical SAM protein with 4Fe4S-binding SPASM domain